MNIILFVLGIATIVIPAILIILMIVGFIIYKPERDMPTTIRGHPTRPYYADVIRDHMQ